MADESMATPAGMPAENAASTGSGGVVETGPAPVEAPSTPEGEPPADLLGMNTPEGQGIDPGPPVEGDGPPAADPDAPATKPDWVEDKFWDAEKGEIRTQDMAKSYRELQKKLSSTRPGEVTVPETYELELPDGMEELGSAEDKLFRELKLDNEQAQAALDFLHEQVIPQIAEAKASVQTTELARLWNMEPKSPEMAARITTLRDWAQAHLPGEVVQHMSRSAAGVQQLWVMMQSGSDVAMPGGTPGTQPVNADQLSSLMDDDYWNGDPAKVAEVERRAGLRR